MTNRFRICKPSSPWTPVGWFTLSTIRPPHVYEQDFVNIPSFPLVFNIPAYLPLTQHSQQAHCIPLQYESTCYAAAHQSYSGQWLRSTVGQGNVDNVVHSSCEIPNRPGWLVSNSIQTTKWVPGSLAYCVIHTGLSSTSLLENVLLPEPGRPTRRSTLLDMIV